jgi:elongation factor P--beta-lysine ligase
MALSISHSIIDTIEYNSLIQKMRDFFLQKNYLEVAVQPRLSI